MEIMEWILANWAYITLGVLVIDKVVAITPMPQDDLIWTAIKAAGRVLFTARKAKKTLLPILFLASSMLLGSCADLTVSEEVVAKILARRVGYNVALCDPVKADSAMKAADLAVNSNATLNTFMDILSSQVSTSDPLLLEDIKDLLSILEFGAPRTMITSNELDYIKSILEAFSAGVKRGIGKIMEGE
jgi:hypothetical protein